MPYRKTSIDLPAMSPGSARSVVVHRFGRPGARPKAYLQAAIHEGAVRRIRPKTMTVATDMIGLLPLLLISRRLMRPTS